MQRHRVTLAVRSCCRASHAAAALLLNAVRPVWRPVLPAVSCCRCSLAAPLPAVHSLITTTLLSWSPTFVHRARQLEGGDNQRQPAPCGPPLRPLTRVFPALHTASPPPAGPANSKAEVTSADIAPFLGDFHTFACDWSADAIISEPRLACLTSSK